MKPRKSWSASTITDATFRSFGREVATYVQASAKSSHGRAFTIFKLPATPQGAAFLLAAGKITMRNNFVADQGDYLKYGLLKHLCQDTLRLGIIWYHFPDEEDNGHGSKVSYLNNLAYQAYDPVLFEQLKALVQAKQSRTIEAVEKVGILPEQTIYYNAPLSFQEVPHFLLARQHRRQWFQQALATIAPCDVVYLDPDNGLEIKGSPPYQHTEGPKYVSHDEVEQLIQMGKTVFIYQHVRQIKVQTLLAQRTTELSIATSYPGPILSVALKAPNEGDSRIFFILPASKHVDVIAKRLEDYKASVWKDFIVHCA